VMDVYAAFNYVHKKMRKKEILQLQKRSFRAHSDNGYQLCRLTIVDWISQVGIVCSLKNLTIHSAVAFLDNFIDCVSVDRPRLQLVAAACILVAAKIEEQEDNIPRIAALSHYSGNTISHELVIKMESFILNKLQWELVILTPLNFLEYYLLVVVSPSELATSPHLGTCEKEKARSYVTKTAEFFVELCQQQSFFREYLPSIVAGSCVAAARQMLQLRPVWCPALQLISGLTTDDISHCFNSIWSYYHQVFPSKPGM